jgi:hypothetical protein
VVLMVVIDPLLIRGFGVRGKRRDKPVRR